MKTATPHLAVLLALILTAVLAAPASAQWEQSGPAWEKINSFTRDADYLYAGSADGGGVYRSADDGRTWTRFTAGLEGRDRIRPVNGVAATAGVVLAATDDGVYRSTDQGQTWARSSNGFQSNPYTYSVFETGGVFLAYAGFSSSQLLYRSEDGGVSWTPLPNAVLLPGTLAFMTTAGDSVFAINSHVPGRPPAFLVSPDRGATWTTRALPTGPFSAPLVGPIGYHGGRIIVGGETFTGLVYSDDAGQTWSRSVTEMASLRFRGLAVHGETAIATTMSGVFTSTDRGQTWAKATEGLPVFGPEPHLHAPFWTGEAFLVSIYDLYPFRSTDGRTWVPSGHGMTQPRALLGIAMRGDTLVTADGNNLFRSTDGGRHWYTPEIPGGSGGLQAVAATDSSFIAIGQLRGLGSRDGRTWRWITAADVFRVERLFVAGDAVYAATQRNGLLKSTDGGQSWATVPGSPTRLVDVVVRGSTILVGEGSGIAPALVVSTDGGATWTRPGVVGGTLAATPTRFFAAMGGIFTGEQLWSSPDGLTWTQLDPPGTVEDLYAYGSTLFASIRDGDVYWSTDDGVTWQTVPRTVTPSARWTSHLLVHRDTLYAAFTPNDGLWKLPLPAGAVTASEPAAGVPQSVALHAAYPNPFNPATTLAYTLPQAARVRLTVADLLGREVAVLVDAVQPAGAHTTGFHAAGLPSGVYLVRLDAGGQVRTRRVVLLK